MLIDTHSHLDLEEDIPSLLEKCEKNLVTKIISISTDLESSKKNLEIASNFKNIFSSVGVHPGSVKNTSKDLNFIEKLGLDENCKAIGEIGLDYFYEGYNKDLQFEFFENQVSISEKLNKPFVIHCRQAYKDAIDFLKSKNPKVQFVFHCFTEDYDTAKKEAVKIGVPFLGEMPLDIELRTTSDESIPLFVKDPKHHICEIYQKIAKVIIKEVETKEITKPKIILS